MPVVGEFHTKYWAGSDTTAPAGRPVGQPGYPMWQSGGNSIVLGSLFGGLAPWWERFWDRVCWWWRVQPRVMALRPDERAVLVRVLDGLDHPAYPVAGLAVRKTATTLGFNRAEAWIDLGRALKRSPGEAENTYRHLEACRLMRANLLSSTVTNPQGHLIVELAYQGFAAKGR